MFKNGLKSVKEKGLKVEVIDVERRKESGWDEDGDIMNKGSEWGRRLKDGELLGFKMVFRKERRINEEREDEKMELVMLIERDNKIEKEEIGIEELKERDRVEKLVGEEDKR